MVGLLRLWSQRKKLRRSISRDPLRTGDPTAWLDGAESVLHLRTSCPHPGWLVHCAYWAELRMDAILAGALSAAEHVRIHGPPGVLAADSVHGLRPLPFPELADLVVDLETRFPAIRCIDHALPTGASAWHSHLRDARGASGLEPVAIDLPAIDSSALVAGGFVLMLVALFHRQAGARESLTITVAAMSTLFALALPAEREMLLAIQRTGYGWPTSMTSTAFVK